MVPSFSRWIRIVAFPLALLSLGSLLPAAASPQEPAEFLLQFEPQFYYSSHRLLSTTLERPVYWDAGSAADPELEGREVRRGAIRVSDERIVRLAWDESGAALFVDRDGDGELSDEQPLRMGGRSGSWLYYNDIRLAAPAGADRGAWTLSLTVSRSRSSSLSATATVQSGWTGKVELGGVEYRLILFDDLDGVFDIGSDQLALIPWGERDRFPTLDTVALPGRVRVEDTTYDFTATLEAGGDGGIVRARFTETSAPLVDVELVGTHVRSLQLGAKGDGPDSTAVFLFDPSATLRLPEGEYLARVELDGGELGALHANLDVVVSAEGEPVLRAGAPLDNSLRVQRNGATALELSYRLLGIGGEEYPVIGRSDAAPRFIARVGEREIASANFRYG